MSGLLFDLKSKINSQQQPVAQDPLADESPDLPAVVKPVSLNAITVQTTFMPLADILPWHPVDPDPVLAYQKREWRVKRVRINTSNVTIKPITCWIHLLMCHLTFLLLLNPCR